MIPSRASLADALLARGCVSDARAALAVAEARPGAAGASPWPARRRPNAPAWPRRPPPGWSWRSRAATRLTCAKLRCWRLTRGDAAAALAAAAANFRLQRELPDVRVLARAATAAHDEAARRQLAEWLLQGGFRDAVTENILAGAARS